MRVDGHVDPLADPRPDLAEESELWTGLLTAAAIDYDDPRDVFGALQATRIIGARLVPARAGWRILPPADMSDADWQA